VLAKVAGAIVMEYERTLAGDNREDGVREVVGGEGGSFGWRKKVATTVVFEVDTNRRAKRFLEGPRKACGVLEFV